MLNEAVEEYMKNASELAELQFDMRIYAGRAAALVGVPGMSDREELDMEGRRVQAIGYYISARDKALSLEVRQSVLEAWASEWGRGIGILGRNDVLREV
jgi:hypothetical protein